MATTSTVATLARPWLPDAAIARGAAALPLTATLRGWAAAWFAGDAAVEGAEIAEVATHTVSVAHGAWQWSAAEDATISASDDLVGRVAEAMVGAPQNPCELTAADHDFLARVAEPCLADLRRRVGELVGVDQPWRPLPADGTGRRRWRAMVAGLPPLTVAIADAAIVRRVRATLPPVAPTRPVRALPAALADQQVAVSARIGVGHVSTADLAALGVGDVVVLDRAIDQPVEIAVERRPQSMRCAIEQDGDHFRLIVQP